METRPSLIPDMVDNGGDAPKMIIKVYGDKAKQLTKELGLKSARGEGVFRIVFVGFRLTSVEGRDIVEVILE